MRQNHRLYTFFVIGLLASAVLATFEGITLLSQGYNKIFPDVSVLRSQYPVGIGKDERQVLYKFQKGRPAHWRSMREISRKAVVAVLMAEDSGFYQHHGFEPEAIRAAWEHNRLPGVKVKRGGSTITQQLAKNLFLSPEKTMTRKIRELLLAVELERKFSKSKILETYLNIAEWGPGVYGIERASQHYFSKSAAELTAWEGAVLAFMLPNPGRYRNSIRENELSEFGTNRVETILERMWKGGYISDEEYSSAIYRAGLSSSL